MLAPLSVIVALGAAAAACAPTPAPAPYAPPSSTAFNAADFTWSSVAGQNGVDGRIEFNREGRTYACTGSAGLTPVTPYTRARFQTLYGSIDRAAVPVAVVRARTVPDPNADYRSFVRSEPCTDGRFAFRGLPDGSWFVIVPVSAGDEPLVLMRRVETRGGRTVSVTF